MARSEGSSFARRLRLGILIAHVAFAFTPSRARADETKECVTAHSDAQELRSAHQLVEARARALRCTSASCPALLVSDCSGVLAELTRSVPTVVFALRDENGIDRTDVSVFIDGKRVQERLDGAAIPIDPGVREIVFRRGATTSSTQTIVVNEGEKDRLVRATIAPAKAGLGTATPLSPQEPRSRWATPPVWVAGAVTALSVASFAYFGLTGQSTKNRLLDTCADTGTCRASDVTEAHDHLLVADISLAVGVIAAAAGVYFLVR